MNKPRAIFIESNPKTNWTHAEYSGQEAIIEAYIPDDKIFHITIGDQTRYAYPRELIPTNDAAKLLLGKLRILGHG